MLGTHLSAGIWHRCCHINPNICYDNRNPYQILWAYNFRKYKVEISDVTKSMPNTLYIEGRVLLPYHKAINIFMDGDKMEITVDMGQTLNIIAYFTWHCLFLVFNHNDAYYPAIHHESPKPLNCYSIPYISPWHCVTHTVLNV